MRVYVSSTFEDLVEHRTAVFQVLRQIGHDVVSMEDYPAADTVPLSKVLADIETCDVLVEIVAWRYGYLPDAEDITAGGIAIANAIPGETSITRYEYLKAVESQKPVLAFLLDERVAWPPHFIEGVRDPKAAQALRAFRAELQRKHMVAYFTTPDSLASRVATALATVGMRHELRARLLDPVGNLAVFTNPQYLSDSYTMPIVNLVSTTPAAVVARIDLSTTWWSTRLFLLAAVGATLGALQRIVFFNMDAFVGMASTRAVRINLRRIHAEADQFERRVLSRSPGADIWQTARDWLEHDWNTVIKAQPGDSGPEQAIQKPVTLANLRLWLGGDLITTPVQVENIETTTVLELMRILDYPDAFVPLVARAEPPFRLADKTRLAEELARRSIAETLDRLGIR
jgi:Domain of unknown function (DUF4062)